MTLDFSMIFQYWQVLLQRLGVTFAFTVSSAIIGCPCGFIVTLLRMSPLRIVRLAITLSVECFRGPSLLIQLCWVFFCFPVVFNLNIPAWLCVLTSLVLYMTAIISETFRGSLKAINGEQHDACTALSLSPDAKILCVIFPQELLRATPTLLSNVVSLFKESALVSSVGIADLMFAVQDISNSTAHTVGFPGAVAVIYFVVAFPLTRLVGQVESRVLQRYAP